MWILATESQSYISCATAQALKAMLGPRTRLVATLHVSNMLGSITDVADLSRAVHAVRRIHRCSSFVNDAWSSIVLCQLVPPWILVSGQPLIR